MSASAAASPAGSVDPRLVDAICRQAAREAGGVEEIVRRHARRLAPLATGPDHEHLVHAAVARLDGLGSLDALMRDPDVDEILVNPGGDVWVERGGVTERVQHLDDDELAVVVERILAPLGRRLDQRCPVVDARLSDGSRVCAVIPPIAPDGPCLSVRRFRDRSLPLAAFGPPEVAEVVDDLIARRLNVVVCGATSSGKTSLLNSVLGRLPPDERVVVVEDTAELRPHHRHLVRLEARPATGDGPPPVSLADLVKTAMRLRPDRLVVGEVRGTEVLGLVQALNTGHDGSWSTCHANGPADALHRLETLVLQAAPTWPLTAIRRYLTRSLDAVVHVQRTASGPRLITAIAETALGDDTGRDLVRDGRVVASPTRERA